MTVDRFNRRFQRELEAEGFAPLHAGTPDDARSTYRHVLAANGPGPSMHRELDDTVSTSDGAQVPVRVLIPVTRPLSVVVYFHGGGWVAGSADAIETIARKLAERTSSAFVLVDYRLAPEHQNLTAGMDCYAAVEWARAQMQEIAGADVPLIVAGDDAGAGLAAGVTLRARDENGPAIDMQVLICPLLDAEVSDAAAGEEQGWLGADAMHWFWDHYVPVVADRADPRLSPLRADDLTGLPAAVVVVAEHSAARSSAETYARRLAEAGVAVDVETYAGQAHGFAMQLTLPIGEKAFQQVIKAVRAYCARPARALPTAQELGATHA